MKILNIKLDYTTGKTDEYKSPEGFLLLKQGDQMAIKGLTDYSVDDAMSAAAALIESTMVSSVKSYGTYGPLFDRLSEMVADIKKSLARERWEKEITVKFQERFLLDTLIIDSKLDISKQKYTDLFNEMTEASTKSLKVRAGEVKKEIESKLN